jgi:hypothetical protein
MRLRNKEEGLLDNDYRVLRNEVQTARIVRDYFKVFSELENASERRIEQTRGYEVYDKLSRQPLRLWYITGCYMARTIEARLGVETLRELVMKGSSDFFETCFQLADHLRTQQEETGE